MSKDKELVIIGMAGADPSKHNERRELTEDTLISDAYTNKNLALERNGINSVQWIINQYLASGLVKEGNFYVAGSNEHFNDVNLKGAKFFDANYSLVTNAIRTLEHVLEEKEDEIKSKNKELWIGFQGTDTILVEEQHIIKHLKDVFDFLDNNPTLDMVLQAVSQEAAEQNISIKSKPSRKFVSYNNETGEKESFRAIYSGLMMLAKPSTEDRGLLKVIGDSMYKRRHKLYQALITFVKTLPYLLMKRRWSAFADIQKGIDLYLKYQRRELSFDHFNKVASQLVYRQPNKVKIFSVTDPDVALSFGGDYDRISDVNTEVSKLKNIKLNDKYLKENYR